MAEFTYPELQTLPYRQAALLNNTSCGCNKGYINHQNGFGSISLSGQCNNPCARFARYVVQYSCNIALSEGATVGEIQTALTLNGEPIIDTIASSTPAAVGDFWHVSGFKTIDVPVGCCPTVAVENVSPPPAAGGANPLIDMRNLNVSVIRTA